MATLGIFAKLGGQTEQFFPKEMRLNAVIVQTGAQLINFGEGFFSFEETIPEVVMLARKSGADGAVFTWIGIYKFLEKRLSGRTGGFFGAGILLKDTWLPGDIAYDTIKRAANGLAEVFRNSVGNQPTADHYVGAAKELFEGVQLEDLCLPEDFEEHLLREERPIKDECGLGCEPNLAKRVFVHLPEGLKHLEESITYFQSGVARNLLQYNRVVLTESATVAAILRNNLCPEFGSDAAAKSLEQLALAVTAEQEEAVTDKPFPEITLPMSELEDNIQNWKGSLERRLVALEREFEVLRGSVGSSHREGNPRRMDADKTSNILRKPTQSETWQTVDNGKLGDFATDLSFGKIAWPLSALVCIGVICAVIAIDFSRIKAFFYPTLQIPIASIVKTLPSAHPPPATMPTSAPSVVENSRGISEPDPQMGVSNVETLLSGLQAMIPAKQRAAFSEIDDLKLGKIMSSGSMAEAKAYIRSDKSLNAVYNQFADTLALEQFVTLLEIDRCLATLVNAQRPDIGSFSEVCPSAPYLDR